MLANNLICQSEKKKIPSILFSPRFLPLPDTPFPTLIRTRTVKHMLAEIFVLQQCSLFLRFDLGGTRHENWPASEMLAVYLCKSKPVSPVTIAKCVCHLVSLFSSRKRVFFRVLQERPDGTLLTQLTKLSDRRSLSFSRVRFVYTERAKRTRTYKSTNVSNQDSPYIKRVYIQL